VLAFSRAHMARLFEAATDLDMDLRVTPKVGFVCQTKHGGERQAIRM
jgi:hypothetical protein